MLLNKRGAALLQVLIVTAILAGMSAMILRLSLSRTITSRQTRHVINAQSVIESCMAEVNAIWASKTPTAYARDLAACQMCDPTADRTDEGGACPAVDVKVGSYDILAYKTHTCSVTLSDTQTYQVLAVMDNNGLTSQPCKITYYILNSRDTL